MFKITNCNESPFPDPFVGRFNGQDYLFPRHKPAMCDDAAAAHIFGIGVPDKAPILARHGWANLTNRLEDGMRILDNFKFDFVAPQFEAPLANEIAYPEDHGPAPVVEKPAAKGGADESPKAAGGDEPEWMQDGPPRAARPADQRPGSGRQARA